MYIIYGNINSSTTIIAVPALGERKEMFQPLAEKLPEYKWLVFDLPGSHQEVLTEYSILSLCHTIKHTMDALQIKQAHFLGNSLGAWAVQAFVAKYPNTVLSLSLLDGGHYFLGERNEPHEDVTLAQGIENFEDIRAAVHEFTYSMPNLETDAYTQFEAYFIHNYTKQGDTYGHHFSEVAYNSLAKELTYVNFCLPNTELPLLLLLAGASADEITRQKAITFQDKFPHAFVITIPNGQHYLPLTNTKQVAEQLRTFMSSIYAI